MEIQITIENKRSTVVGEPVIICGNADYTIKFTFDSEWTAADKTARFVFTRSGELKYTDVNFSGDTVAVPVLSGIKSVEVGVFEGERLTSTPALIPCERSIRCGVTP